MRQKLKGFSKLTAIAIVFSLILFVGCSDNFSVNSDNSRAIQSPITNSGARLLIPMESLSGDPIVTEDSKLITKDDGGEISIIRDEYEHTFTVDPDALDESVEITVSSYEDNIWGHKAIVFEFDPDGLVFEDPAKLEFKMAELNSRAKYAKLFYYYPDFKLWVLKSVRLVDEGNVVFEIDHFSRYAISD